MFYGIIHEEYDYYVLTEFDLKGTINTIKTKVKNAILVLVNKIDKLLNNCKDGKIKSALKSLLSKVKKLLGEVEEAETDEEVKEYYEKYKDCFEEFKKYAKDTGPYFEDAIREGKQTRCIILIKDALLIYRNNNFDIADKMWKRFKEAFPDYINNDPEIIKKFKEECKNDNEDMNLVLSVFGFYGSVQDLNDGIYNYTKSIVKKHYNL